MFRAVHCRASRASGVGRADGDENGDGAVDGDRDGDRRIGRGVLEHVRGTLQASREWSVPFCAGIASGVAVAGMFNPWDRALYLAVKDAQPFLHRGNWLQPYQGFQAAVVQRTLSGSGWFIMNDWVLVQLERMSGREGTSDASAVNVFVAANVAGAANGFILNPMSVVKYHNWGKDNPGGFFRTAGAMVRARGSIRPMIRGLGTTIARDVVFGGVFASGRLLLTPLTGTYIAPWSSEQAASFVTSIVAAAAATTVSSPFNFARNIKYASPSNTPSPSTTAILLDFGRALRSHEAPLSYIRLRFQIGWGTARVAVGMAVGWELYVAAKSMINSAIG